MTVAQLIEKLKEFPPEMDVRLCDPEDWAPPCEIATDDFVVRHYPHESDCAAKVPFLQLGRP